MSSQWTCVKCHLKNGCHSYTFVVVLSEQASNVNAEIASDFLTITGSLFEMEQVLQDKTLNPTGRKYIFGAATNEFMRGK